ncbi:MAG: hypothetical protein LUG61_11820 [Lachnospiraceae bacterium]|nr:hypothetical protein [Lachnospiraceae bacterium]
MSIKSKWNTFVQRNRDAAELSAHEMRALTNQYEACHGDFAYLPEQRMARTDELTETYPQSNNMWKAAFAR